LGYHEQILAGVGYQDGYFSVYVPPKNFYRWPFKLQRAYLLAWSFGRYAQMKRQRKKTIRKWRKMCIL
jgi:hypothetical protein